MLSCGWERRYTHRGGSWGCALRGSEFEWYDCSIAWRRMDYSIAWQRMDYAGLRLVRRVS
jgi:hypothetical protein